MVTAAADTPIADLAHLLTTHRISAVPIVDDDDRVLGVVSEADLLPKIAASGATSDRTGRRRRTVKAAPARRGS